MKSEITKRYTRLSRIFLILEAIILTAPLIGYLIVGLRTSEPKEQVTLTATAMMALVLTSINLGFKCKFRSPIWLLLIGIYIAVDDMLPLILMIAAGSIIDEFLLSPLNHMFRSKASINCQIDKRL